MGKIIQLMIIFFRKVICTRNTFNKKKLHECKKCQVFNKKKLHECKKCQVHGNSKSYRSCYKISPITVWVSDYLKKFIQ